MYALSVRPQMTKTIINIDSIISMVSNLSLHIGTHFVFISKYTLHELTYPLLGNIQGLQQIRVSNNPKTKNPILLQTKSVHLQFQSILLSRGSSASSFSDAAYISGMPAPGLNSARCFSIILTPVIGSKASLMPLIFSVIT